MNRPRVRALVNMPSALSWFSVPDLSTYAARLNAVLSANALS